MPHLTPCASQVQSLLLLLCPEPSCLLAVCVKSSCLLGSWLVLGLDFGVFLHLRFFVLKINDMDSPLYCDLFTLKSTRLVMVSWFLLCCHVQSSLGEQRPVWFTLPGHTVLSLMGVGAGTVEKPSLLLCASYSASFLTQLRVFLGMVPPTVGGALTHQQDSLSHTGMPPPLPRPRLTAKAD